MFQLNMSKPIFKNLDNFQTERHRTLQGLRVTRIVNHIRMAPGVGEPQSYLFLFSKGTLISIQNLRTAEDVEVEEHLRVPNFQIFGVKNAMFTRRCNLWQSVSRHLCSLRYSKNWGQFWA